MEAVIPAWLERLVWLAIPPCAREGVAGDLWETRGSPRQYAAEALRTVPFVIASQMRRNLNLPALVLQTMLIALCLGSAAAFAAVPLLLLRDAYQPAARPSPRRALREAVVVAFGGLLLLQALTSGLMRQWNPAERDFMVFLQLFFIGPVFLPVLCFLRTGVIVDGDRHGTLPDTDLSRDELALACRDFRHKARRRDLLEAVALALAAVLLGLWHPALPHIALAGGFALAALYLLRQGRAAPGEAGGDFIALRARYQQALLRYHQLRRFLWWLWLSPALLTLQAHAVTASPAARQPLAMLPGAAGGVLLCFLVAALNRERGGRVQEQISALSAARERFS